MRYLLSAGAALVLAASPAAEAGDAHVLTVSAQVLSKSNCKFTAPSSTIALVIDPAASGSVSASASVSFRCSGAATTAAWMLSHGNGLYGTSPSALRMRHASIATEFLPYTLSHPASGTAPKNVVQTVSVTAAVAAADFQNALPGTYNDSIALSLLP